MKTINLTEEQLETLFKCIGSRNKNLRESHKNNEKNGRTNCVEKNLASLKANSELEKTVHYQIIDSVGFYEKE